MNTTLEWSDSRLTELCAEAMGWKHLGPVGKPPPKRSEPDPKGPWCLSGGNDWWEEPERGDWICGPCQGIPDPLHDDAHAMALVKKLYLEITPHNDGSHIVFLVRRFGTLSKPGPYSESTDLNRAIVTCVAEMQRAKCLAP